MKNNNLKNFLAGIFIPIIFFLFLEIFFTAFLIFFRNDYNPLIKYLVNNNSNDDAETVEIRVIKSDKYTKKMVPGIYRINNYDVKINSQGFRGKDFSIKNLTGCRIISFGGSTTLGINNKKHYPLILEEILKKDNFNCEVLNFGSPGASLNLIEYLIVGEAVNYSPNIITIMTNGVSTKYDSFGNSSRSSDIINNKFQLYLYKINKFCYKNIMTYKFMDLASRRVVNWFIHSKEKIPSPFAKNYHLKKYFSKKFLNQLINIANFAKSKNIKLVLIKEAYFVDLEFQKKIKLLSKPQLINRLVNYQTDSYENKVDLFWMLTYEILNKTLEDVKLSNPEVIIVDPISKLFASEKNVNFQKDGIHLSSKGNKIIAKEIFDKIKDEI